MSKLPCAAIPSALQFNKFVKLGDRGRDVKLAQEWLTYHGFATTLDAEFGPATELCLKRFQAKSGIAETAGVDVRGRFIIDPDGVIQAIEVLTPPVGRKVAESIRQIQAFQHVRATKGAEVCPAGWEPGKPVLKVGPDLAGNVWKVWKPNE